MARRLFAAYDVDDVTLDQDTVQISAPPFGITLRSQDPTIYTASYPAAGDYYSDVTVGPIAKGTFVAANGESGGAAVTAYDDRLGNIIGSTVLTQSLGAGNGILVTFTGTLAGTPIAPGTIELSINPAGAGAGYDDGVGGITGPAVSTGTIDYTTGAISITLLVAPTGAQTVDLEYLGAIGTIDYDDKAWNLTWPASVTAGLLVTIGYKIVRTACGGEYREGIVQYPTWTADNIVELFGFEAIEEHVYTLENGVKVQETDVRYQVSTDGGTTWLHWTGLAWSKVTLQDDHWDPWATVDANIQALTFLTVAGGPGANRKSMTVRARLTPATSSGSFVQDLAPKLRAISILHEVAYEFEEDLRRSLKRHLENGVRVLERQVLTGQTAATTFQLQVHEYQSVSSNPSISFVQPSFATDWAAESSLVQGKVWVYNLTTDPHRTRPYKATINESTGLVTLDGAVAAQTGSIEIWFYCSVPTYIAVDDRINVSTSRALLVQLSSSAPLPYNSAAPLYGEVEAERSRQRVRLRVPSQVFESTMTIRCQAPTTLEASSIVSAVQRLVATRANVTSVATGQPYCFKDYGEPSGEVASPNGLGTESFSVQLQGTRFYPGYRLEYLVLELNLALGTQDFKSSLGNALVTEADL